MNNEYNNWVDNQVVYNKITLVDLTDDNWDELAAAYEKTTGKQADRSPSRKVRLGSGNSLERTLQPEEIATYSDEPQNTADKKVFNDTLKTQREYSRNVEAKIRRDAIDKYELPSKSGAQLAAETATYMTKQRDGAKDPMPVIDKAFGKVMPLTLGNMFVFAARAKGGKTSLGTSICHSLYKDKKRVLFISNEESVYDIYGRIAGTVTDNFFNEVHRGNATQSEIDEMSNSIVDIANYITVQAKDESALNLMVYQDMKQVLETARISGKYDVIMIDYLSNVKEDLDNPGGAEHDAQARLYSYLNGLKLSVPIIAFTQIKQSAKVDEAIGTAVEGRKTLANVATALIEVIPNKATLTTTLKLNNLRWADTEEWFLEFDKGKLLTISAAEWERRMLEADAKQVENSSKTSQDDEFANERQEMTGSSALR